MSRMQFIRRVLTTSLLALWWSPDPASLQQLRTADLGECPLESGETLAPCVVGYRTLGSLDEARDNAILVPTWFTGTSEEVADFAITYVDTATFYLIAVDALGNGVSTSPSNSPTQGGESFPRISIGDMVESQHRLVTEVLGLDRLYAVTGASMGGMQTFEWAVAYPDFVGKALPMIGSPRLGPYDIALWETELRILDLYEACGCPEAAATLAGLWMLTGSSPEDIDSRMDPAEVETSLETAARAYLERPDGWTHDTASQLHAMIGHDVSRRFGADMAAAAEAIEAGLLSVVVSTDHVVTPWVSIEFVEMAGGESIVVDDPGGHGGLFAPDAGYEARVRAFLARDE